MTEEQFQQLISTVSNGLLALASALEANAKSEKVWFSTKNLAGDTLTINAESLEELEARLEDLDGDADVRRVHIASFTPQFKADAAQGADFDTAMGGTGDFADSDSEAGLAYKVLGRQLGAAGASGGGGAAPAADLPSCPECGGEVWDNRKWIAKYGGDGSSKDNAPPYKCKDKGCATPIGIDGKRHNFGGGRGRGRAA